MIVGCGAMAYFAIDLYRLHSFPPGYRSRPTTGWHRPGKAEFDIANDRIENFKGTNAFGNSLRAIELAADFSRTLQGRREALFTGSKPKFEILESTKGEFLTYCELHENECAFIVHVPGLRRFEESAFEKVDARKALAQLAWQTAQRVLTVHAVGKPKLELAVGLRGLSQYSPIQLGYYAGTSTNPDAGPVKYIDGRADEHPIDSTAATRAGAAYLFTTNGTLLHTFTKNSAAPDEFLSRVVAAAGNREILVGAWGDNEGAVDSGTAYLFEIPYPTLNIKADESDVFIYWVAEETGLILQETGGLGSPAIWSDAIEPVITQGTTNSVQQSLSSTNRFYRLRRP